MSSHRNDIRVARLEGEAGRQRALAVMQATYRDEKNWLNRDDQLVDPAELADPDVSWFLATRNDTPVGVLRALYAPPLDLYATYGFQLVTRELDLAAFIRNHRIAEIGRFAVVAPQRGQVLVSAALMRAALAEAVDRGFTHYITDVFEGEAHSPLEFHKRVLGFEVVATHEVGELNCPNRRITLLLDIRRGLRRLRDSGNWLFRHLTEGWSAARFRAAGLEVPAAPAPATVEAR
ncbi:MAG: GNAT family N-acetyltransferase [Verrucomicrobiae bacterium]|nr:GNAT family N-acetyltransferase [Verrucomicrobiae bacterium]